VEKLREAALPIVKNLDITLAVILFIQLLSALLPKNFYISTGFLLTDIFLSALAGSLLLGNPTNGYIIGHALLERGLSPLALSALLAAWVTVGLLQVPLEAKYLGRRFALARNIVAFALALLLSLLGVIL